MTKKQEPDRSALFVCTLCELPCPATATWWWPGRGPLCGVCTEFWVFHTNNPNVYASLVHEGRALLARGHRKFGIKALFERLRWHHYMETWDDSTEFKLNNNYHSLYARLIVEQEPDFDGIFQLRALARRRSAA